MAFEGALEAAFSLKPGEIGEPIRGEASVLTFRVLEERDKGIAPFEEVLETVRDAVKKEEGKARSMEMAKAAKERLTGGQSWEEALKTLQEVKVQESQPVSLYSPYGQVNITGFPGADVELLKKAFALKPGEISDVVEGAMGCYLFEVVKREEPDWSKFDAAQMKQTLAMEKQRDFYEQWMTSLKEQAKKDGKLEILMDVKQPV